MALFSPIFKNAVLLLMLNPTNTQSSQVIKTVARHEAASNQSNINQNKSPELLSMASKNKSSAETKIIT